MDCSIIFTLAGLIFGVLASLVLIIPNLNIKKDLNDDYIVAMDKEGKYTQRKHLKEKNLNILGLVFLAIGFLLQLSAIFVGIEN